jgi:hypothetical protein
MAFLPDSQQFFRFGANAAELLVARLVLVHPLVCLTVPRAGPGTLSAAP